MGWRTLLALLVAVVALVGFQTASRSNAGIVQQDEAQFTNTDTDTTSIATTAADIGEEIALDAPDSGLTADLFSKVIDADAPTVGRRPDAPSTGTDAATFYVDAISNVTDSVRARKGVWPSTGRTRPAAIALRRNHQPYVEATGIPGVVRGHASHSLSA
jgi:hypothetical protein